jgi:hypothetical protein
MLGLRGWDAGAAVHATGWISVKHLAFLTKLKTNRRSPAVREVGIGWSVNLALINDGEAPFEDRLFPLDIVFGNVRSLPGSGVRAETRRGMDGYNSSPAKSV